MRLFIMAVALACAGCAAPVHPPQFAQERYMQLVDPATGKTVEEIEAASGEACRIAQAEEVRQYGLASPASLIRCSATSVANQLPYRMTVREKSTRRLMDWKFLTLAGCQDTAAATKLMEGYTLVAQCSSR